MLPLRYAARWHLASLLLLVFVLAATMMPAYWIFPTKRDFLSWFVDVDKWLHGITFVVLAIWFAGQYRAGAYWRIAVGLMAFGVLIEACQRLVTYRSAEAFDLVADAAGIAVGLLIAAAGAGGWSLKLENRFAGEETSTDID